jgi:hypothetical protein
MKTILIFSLNFFFITIVSCSQKNETVAQKGIESVYDEWKEEMSGVYEGIIEARFADGGCTDIGIICIDLLSDSPTVSIDGVIISGFDLTKNTIRNILQVYPLMSIYYDKISNSCIASYDDEFLMNDGKETNYVWYKTGDPEKAKANIEKLKSDDKIFFRYWEKFIYAFKNNDFKEITSKVSYPIIDSCTKEIFNNEIELENKLIRVIESVAVDDLENETGWMRIADIMAKKLGGRYYFQRNASIFFDVVDGEVKLMNFHCLFG